MLISKRRPAQVRVLHEPVEVFDRTLGERVGVPQIGWMPELVAMMVVLSTVGMVVGALTVDAAVLIMTLSAVVVWTTFARLPQLVPQGQRDMAQAHVQRAVETRRAA